MVTLGSAKLNRAVTVAVAVLVAVSVAVVGINAGTAGGTDIQQEALQQESDQSSNETNLSEANTTLRGIMENDSAGWSVAEAGDVNGDGETDLLVGAPRRHNNSSNTGTAYLFYGPVDEGDIDLSDANVTFEGPQRSDRTGVAVAGGDLNGNGYADVVIGAPHSNNSDDDRFAGQVYVIPGGEDLNETLDLGNESAVINGEDWGDHAGYSLDVVNHSAEESDLVVGAPYNNSTETTAGAVHLIDGDEIEFDAGATQSLDTLGTKYAGEGNGDRAGWSVADAGDVNGDDRHDVIVGAYRNDTEANAAGAAYVIYGDDENESQNDTTLAEADAKLAGVEANDFTGYSVDGAGDVDGDGLADVIVGAPYNNETDTDAGAAYVVRGANISGDVSLDDAALKLYGESGNDLAGFAVSGGPCNESVYVGAPNADNASGSAYAVGGDATGEASLAGAAATYHGEGQGDGAGFSLAGATNLTADDTEELLVGAPYHDANANDSGAAYILTDACPTSEEDVTDVKPEPTDDREDVDQVDEDDETTIPVHDEPEDDNRSDGDDAGDDETETEDTTETETGDSEETETDGEDTNETDLDGGDTNETDSDGEDANETEPDSGETNETDSEDTNETDGEDTNETNTDTEDSNETDADNQTSEENETNEEIPVSAENVNRIETGEEVNSEEYDGWYSFEAEEGESIRLTLGSGHYSVELYGPDGESLLTDSGTTETTSTGTVAPETGTYYIEVTSDMSPHRIKVDTDSGDRYESNSERSEAASVGDDAQIAATLRADDQDWYAVSADAEEEIRVRLERTYESLEHGNDLRVRIVDDNGNTLSDEQTRIGPTAGEDVLTVSASVITKQSGTYYVVVEDVNVGGFASYEMNVETSAVADGGSATTGESENATTDDGTQVTTNQTQTVNVEQESSTENGTSEATDDE